MIGTNGQERLEVSEVSGVSGGAQMRKVEGETKVEGVTTVSVRGKPKTENSSICESPISGNWVDGQKRKSASS